MDENLVISKKCIQVKYGKGNGSMRGSDETDLNYSRMLQDLPEPRIHHAAICMRGLLIVTGGLSSMHVEMQGDSSEVLCQQKCWMMPVSPHAVPRWQKLPDMEFAGGLGASLVSIDSRYVYQIGGSNPQC